MPNLSDYYRRGTTLTVKDEGVELGTDFEILDIVGDGIVAVDSGSETATITVDGIGELDDTGYNKGDLVVHNGSGFVPLPVGSTGQSLTANDATATGLEWATISGTDSNISTLNTSISHYWAMEQDTILDQNDLVGTLNLQSSNSPTQDLGTGLIANAVAFNGSNSVFNVTSSPQDITTDQRYTLSFWVKFDNNTTNQFVYESLADGSPRHQIVYDETLNQLLFILYGTPANQTFILRNSFIPSSNYHHIVLSVDEVGGVLNAFFDGGQTLNNEPINVTTVQSATTSSTIRWGQRNAVNDGLIGSLDEIAYWSRNLSLNEVSELYRNGQGITFPFPELIVIDGLYEFPRSELGLTVSTQTLSDNVPLVVSWDTVRKNNSGFFGVSTPTRLTADADGLYHIEANVVIDAAASDIEEFSMYVIVNGVTTGVEPYPLFTREFTIPAGGLPTLSLSGEIDLLIDDYVELAVVANYATTSGDSFLTPSIANRFTMRRAYASLNTESESKGGRIRLASSQSIVSNTQTQVLFGQEVYDTSTFFTINNPFRLVAPENGIVLLDAEVSFANNATGDRTVVLYKTNGLTVTELARNKKPAATTGSTIVSVSSQDFASVDDEYYLEVVQDSGSNLSVETGSYLSLAQVVINQEQDQTVIQNLVSNSGAIAGISSSTNVPTGVLTNISLTLRWMYIREWTGRISLKATGYM